MDKKNLLILVPTLQLGGQERVAVNTANIMSEDYNITFVVFDSKEAVYKPSSEVINLAIPAVPGKLNKVKNSLRRARVLRKIKQNKHIDFSLSFGSTANLVNVLSGHRGKIIINLRGYNAISDRYMDRFVYDHCDKIVCCAQDMCDTLVENNDCYEKKTVCIYNPYDTKQLWKKGQEPISDYIFNTHTIVTHGRLEEVKNYPRLIKAFFLVQQQVTDAQLLIIGDGTQRQKLESLISAYHLEGSITLLGFRENPFAYLAKSSLYVLSSYSEGFPNALVEGMTFLPAVAVNCKSGPREILSNGHINRVTTGFEESDFGILVQPAAKREFCTSITEDDRVLADAMLAVLTDPAKAKALQGKGKSRASTFSYEAYKEKLKQIF